MNDENADSDRAMDGLLLNETEEQNEPLEEQNEQVEEQNEQVEEQNEQVEEQNEQVEEQNEQGEDPTQQVEENNFQENFNYSNEIDNGNNIDNYENAINTEIPVSNNQMDEQPQMSEEINTENKAETIIDIDTNTQRKELPEIGEEIENKKEEDFEESDYLQKIEPMNVKQSSNLSPDCFTGADIAPSELLKDLLRADMVTILQPLLTQRTSCFRNMSVESIMTWQKKEIEEPLLVLPDQLELTVLHGRS